MPSDAVDAMPDALPATCTPSAMACAGRESRTCGANGQWDPDKDVTCDFTCVAGACVAASNVQSVVTMCTSTAHELAPPAGATVTLQNTGGTGNGVHFTCAPSCGETGVTEIDLTTKIMTTNPHIALFCLSSVDVPAGLNITVAPDENIDAIALVVDGNATIAGTLTFDGGNAAGAAAGAGGPGASDGAPLSGMNKAGANGKGACPGTGGDSDGTTTTHAVGGGGAGASGSSLGGGGGSGACTMGDHLASGGGGSVTCGTATLIPLVGGSGGGGGGDGVMGGNQGFPGGGGGGALQISVRGALAVSGTLHSSGGKGFGTSAVIDVVDGAGGGGAGGAFLLEAQSLNITGLLDVDGGAGGAAGAGSGGKGATAGNAAAAGSSHAANGQGGAGGGGGGGFIRINGPNAACPASASPTGACTTGTLPPQ